MRLSPTARPTRSSESSIDCSRVRTMVRSGHGIGSISCAMRTPTDSSVIATRKPRGSTAISWCARSMTTCRTRRLFARNWRVMKFLIAHSIRSSRLVSIDLVCGTTKCLISRRRLRMIAMALLIRLRAHFSACRWAARVVTITKVIRFGRRSTTSFPHGLQVLRLTKRAQATGSRRRMCCAWCAETLESRILK